MSGSVSVFPVRLCRWQGGKKAAVSLRFDDSHPTHIEIAVPELDKRGLVGTFLVNPGNANYQKYRETWEGAVLSAGHELGDHTLNHRGAKDDKDAEQQVGEPALLLHRLQPQAKQITFVSGGATLWTERKPLPALCAKYHLFDLYGPGRENNAMSCSVVYASFSVDAFRKAVEKAVVEGDWLQPHFHQIDEKGHLRITPPVFAELLDALCEYRADVWQAGIRAIQQYENERDHSRVWVAPEGDDGVSLYVTCGTDPALYVQPLTIEADLPGDAAAPVVKSSAGEIIASSTEDAGGKRVVRFDVPPVDGSYSLRAPGIGHAYREAQSLSIAAPGPHPYLLFTAADAPSLLAKAKDPLANQMWSSLLSDADQYAEEDPETAAAAAVARWQRVERSNRIRALSFAYAVTRERKYAGAAIKHLVTFSQETSWHEENSDTLITVAAICTMGLAYDWLYDALTPDERAGIRSAMITYGLEPVARAVEKGEWWTRWDRCNWGAVIYGQAGVAAMALLPDEPRAADWVRVCQRNIWPYLQALGDDGGWGESGNYGAYLWSNALLFMEAQRRVLGVDFLDDPKLRLLPYWSINLLDPSGENYVPFLDCNAGTGNTAELLSFLAREFRDGRVQSVARQVIQRRGRPSALLYLWFDPSVEPQTISDLPLDKSFPSLDWAMMRSKWEDPRALLFAMKAGQEDWDHHHHDIGSFALYANGQPLLVDYLYPHTLWGCEAESHSTIIVNGKDQRGRVKVAGGRGNPDNRGVIGELVSAPWYARLVSDNSMAYEQDDVKSWVREVMYLRHEGAADPPDYLVLFDDAQATAPSHIDWLFQTYGDIRFAEPARGWGDTEPSGANVVITHEDVALDMTLVAPDQMRREVYERTVAESGVESPSERVQAVRFLKTWPRRLTDRGQLVSILAPRNSSDAASMAVTGIRESNVLGADIATGSVRDTVLFAFDAPEIKTAGVEAIGRSCFVRRSGGRLTGLALHKGQRVSVDGTLIFESNTSGHAIVTLTDAAIDATLHLYGPITTRFFCPGPPRTLTINGEERPFEYDAQSRCVTIEHPRPRQVHIAL